MLAGGGRLVRPLEELTESQVAVGDERAHAELGGEGDGLLVVSLRGLDLGRIAMGGDLAQKPQGLGLDPPLFPVTRQRQGAVGQWGGVSQVPREEIRLPSREAVHAGAPTVVALHSTTCAASASASFSRPAWA